MCGNIFIGATTGFLSAVGVLAILCGFLWFGILCLVASYLIRTA